MKFPRNVKTSRSPFELAPFAAVFFLLIIFVMMMNLLPTPGVPMQLQPPSANDLPGIDKPSVSVAMDALGRYFFKDKIVTEAQLQLSLSAAAKNSRVPLMLVIHTDKSITYSQLLHLTLLARNAGITNALLATLPRTTDASTP